MFGPSSFCPAFDSVRLLILVPAALTLASSSVRAQTPTSTTLPLKPARTIEFTTDEGTWISIDVSPDGRTILFDMLGDIYTMPISGGVAKPMFQGMAYEDQPRWSPDGRHIVFVSDRDGSDNLWIASHDGSGARQLTRERRSGFAAPVWSSDGRFVIASREGGRGGYVLWMYGVEGGSGMRFNN